MHRELEGGASRHNSGRQRRYVGLRRKQKTEVFFWVNEKVSLVKMVKIKKKVTFETASVLHTLVTHVKPCL